MREAGERLDTSIDIVDKAVQTGKQRRFDNNKAEAFFTRKFKITEKFDGTKLTLYRNDQEFDPKDYKKNWVIAYKGTVMFADEFEDHDSDEVKTHSIGMHQYGLVHRHMVSVHSKTSKIPKETEFQIEFIQNKDTTTRDYAKKHGLFILAYSPSVAQVSHGHIKTTPAGWYNDDKTLTDYSNALNMMMPPVVFDGSFKDGSTIKKSIKNKKLMTHFNELKEQIESSDPETKFKAIKDMFLNFDSELGGKTEGVVLDPYDGERMLKILQSDQHDKKARGARKEIYRMDYEKEKTFREKLLEIASNKIIEEGLGELPVELALKQARDIIKKLNSLPHHEKKNPYQVREELYTTFRVVILGSNKNKVPKQNASIFVGRFQPMTKAHANVLEDFIKKKFKDIGGKLIIAIVDTGVTDTQNPFSFDYRKKMINQVARGRGIPVTVIKFESGNLKREISNLEKDDYHIVGLIAGEDRIVNYRSQLDKMGREDIKSEMAKGRGVTGHDLEHTSGTAVREALMQNQLDKFKSMMPPELVGWFDDMRKKLGVP